MSRGRVGGRPRDGDRDDGPAASLGAADWMSLAAAPAFATMAVMTATLGGGPAESFCSLGHGAPILGSMVPMYALMSAVHVPPWIRMVTQRSLRVRPA